MSQITIQMDTVTKTLSVEMDGVKLENVDHIDICNTAMYGYSEPSNPSDDDEDTFYIGISMSDRSREDMTTHTRISANAKGQVVETALSDEILAYLEN